MQLFTTAAATGAWNMAVDEAMLMAAAERSAASLRFYQWIEPTLSLGYFQSHAQRSSHPASLACPWVRRSSGGGAIMHDRELTYSLTLPVGASKAAAADLYTLMHATLIEALAGFGIEATYAQEDASSFSFLCFQRRAAGDVLVDGVKIAGSAQRRHGGAVLQHGSVLLARSAAAPELAGIAEMGGQAISADDLTAAWLERLHARGWQTVPVSPLPGWLVELATRLCPTKYEAAEWNLRR